MKKSPTQNRVLWLFFKCPRCQINTLELSPCDNYRHVTIVWPCPEVVIISDKYCTHSLDEHKRNPLMYVNPSHSQFQFQMRHQDEAFPFPFFIPLERTGSGRKRERERPLSPSSSCSRFSEGHLLIRGLSYTTSAKLWIFLGVILTYSTNLKGFLTPPILCRRHIWKLPHPRRISHGNGRLNSVGPWVGLTPACKQEIWIMGQIDDKHIFALKGMF